MQNREASCPRDKTALQKDAGPRHTRNSFRGEKRRCRFDLPFLCWRSVFLLLIASTAGVGPARHAVRWALAGAVLVAVHHAEVVAHRLGELFGTLVLALAVAAIEAALILSMMAAGARIWRFCARRDLRRCHDHLHRCRLAWRAAAAGGLARCMRTEPFEQRRANRARGVGRDVGRFGRPS